MRLTSLLFALLVPSTAPAHAADVLADSPATTTAHATSRPVGISDLLDLSRACRADASEAGTHGGTQSRVCRTSHGTYVAYLGTDAQGAPVIHLIRIREGQPSLLFTRPTNVSGSNGVHVVAAAGEEVFVVAPGGGMVDGREQALLSAFHIDRETGTATEHRATVPFGRGSSYGYSSVCVDAAGKRLYAVYSGGDAPGYFAWFAFETDRRQWAPQATVADLKFRHCYNYCFADGTGGMAVLSERDVKNATAGITPADTNRKIDANYVWDELRLFLFDDLASPRFTAVDVEAAVYDKPAGLYPTVQNNWQGDTYLDAQGRLHVLYLSDDNHRRKGAFLRHAVFDAQRRCLRNELLPFQGAHAMRMAQSTGGRHFIIAMQYDRPARVQVWGAADADGFVFEPLAEKQLSPDVTPTYAGLAVSCPRNGSRQDDRIDCLFPSGHRYYHFRVDLPGPDRGPSARRPIGS